MSASTEVLISVLIAVAGLSLLVERTVEILKHVLQFASKTGGARIQSKKEEKRLGALRVGLERLKGTYQDGAAVYYAGASIPFL